MVRKHNKPRPSVAHRGIARFLGIAQKCIRSSHGHSTPSLKISCKSVQPFSRNLANKETKKERYKQTKQRNKEIDRKQYPVPRSIGDGVTCTFAQISYLVVHQQAVQQQCTDTAARLQNHHFSTLLQQHSTLASTRPFSIETTTLYRSYHTSNAS